MAVTVNPKVVPFGQIVWEMGWPIHPEEPSTLPSPKEIRYHVPQETVPRIQYEIVYGQRRREYVVPSSTG